MSNQPQTGDLLGRMFDRRYRVNELIGSGGMGSVYRATHLEMNREVALKVLERGVADTDKQVQRFYQEARASSRLQHPNTIRVFDFGRADDGRLYLAMEYLRGETLTELLKRQKRLSVDRSCHIIRQVCKSLAEAHQVGIVHRDLKPDNIFITDIYGERDFVKVLDFGIAKSTENDGQESLTQTGFICGTPRYLSPEQAMGKSIDARSDLYSVGVILFEMLSGHPPFAASTPIALVMKHIHEPPPRLPDGGKERAQWMSSLVFGLMQKVPARRPPSSVIVSQALDDIARGLQPAGLVQRSQSVVARNSSRARAASVLPNRRRTNTLLAGSSPAPRRNTDRSSGVVTPLQAHERNDNSSARASGQSEVILVDEPQDAVTSRGVVAAVDPQEEVTNSGVSAMIDPEDEPTRLVISAMVDSEAEPTRVAVPVMVDPEDAPTTVGVPAMLDSGEYPAVSDGEASAVLSNTVEGAALVSRDDDDLARIMRGGIEPASSVVATIEEQAFAAGLVPSDEKGGAPLSDTIKATTESSGNEQPVSEMLSAANSSSPDFSNMTRVMQSPLEISGEGLPVGQIDSGPKWPNYAVAAITILAICAGGIAVWQLDGRAKEPKVVPDGETKVRPVPVSSKPSVVEKEESLNKVGLGNGDVSGKASGTKAVDKVASPKASDVPVVTVNAGFEDDGEPRAPKAVVAPSQGTVDPVEVEAIPTGGALAAREGSGGAEPEEPSKKAAPSPVLEAEVVTDEIGDSAAAKGIAGTDSKDVGGNASPTPERDTSLTSADSTGAEQENVEGIKDLVQKPDNPATNTSKGVVPDPAVEDQAFELRGDTAKPNTQAAKAVAPTKKTAKKVKAASRLRKAKAKRPKRTKPRAKSTKKVPPVKKVRKPKKAKKSKGIEIF